MFFTDRPQGTTTRRICISIRVSPISIPEGFEIMDIRLGGLKQRVLSCKRRIEQYINGEISEIPELCEAVLEKTNGIFWSRIISAGRISMHL